MQKLGLKTPACKNILSPISTTAAMGKFNMFVGTRVIPFVLFLLALSMAGWDSLQSSDPRWQEPALSQAQNAPIVPTDQPQQGSTGPFHQRAAQSWPHYPHLTCLPKPVPTFTNSYQRANVFTSAQGLHAEKLCKFCSIHNTLIVFAHLWALVFSQTSTLPLLL